MEVPMSGLYPDLSKYNIDGTTGAFVPAASAKLFTADDHAKIKALFEGIKKDNIFQKFHKKEEAPIRAQEYFTPVVEEKDMCWYHRPTFSSYSACYHRSYTFISFGSPPTPARHEVRRKEKDDDGMNRGTQVLLATVAAVVVATAIYFVGKALAQIENTKERIDIIKDYKKDINNCSTNLKQTTLDDNIKDIFENRVFTRYTKFLDLAKKVEKSEIRSKQLKIILMVIAAAGAVILAIGAVAASWPLALVGMGVVAVGGLGLLGRASYESALGNVRQERAIQKQLGNIQKGEAEIEEAFARWEDQLSQLSPPAFNPESAAPSAPGEDEDLSKRGDYDDLHGVSFELGQ